MIIAGLLFASPLSVWASPRVFSLDQCADQYVLALGDRASIVGLSKRADDADAFLRREATGLLQSRATREAVLAARPEVVVRYWGGSPTLLQALQRRGVKVVSITEASSYDEVRGSVRRVAEALDRPERGAAIVAAMDAKLARAQGAWRGKPALYLSAGGSTTGPGTMMDAMLKAAGLTNVTAAPGYSQLRLEDIVRVKPAALVLGFFERTANALEHWGLGRHRIMQRLMQERAIASLPASVLTCPAWYTADGALMLAQARR